jgi:hypothetical protein
LFNSIKDQWTLLKMFFTTLVEAVKPYDEPNLTSRETYPIWLSSPLPFLSYYFLLS